MIREYAYTGRWADGSIHTDTVYVVHGDPEHRIQVRFHMATGPQYKPAVFDVQDYPNERLAMPMDRRWAAAWLRIRRLAGLPDDDPRVAGLIPLSNEGGAQYNNPQTGHHELRIQGGWFHRRRAHAVPNMPISAYAEDKIVLHDAGDGGLSGYGYRYGEAAGGTSFTERHLDAVHYDDFHRSTECEVHGDRLLCPKCGHNYGTQCGRENDCDCEAFDFSVIESCPGCGAMYDCETGACHCIDALEQCAKCSRDLGDGDTVWVCMDGGEVYCEEHVVFDERPDSLFKRVGGVRGAHLPEFAWPGGYCIVYYTRDNSTVCADCADQVETSDPAVDVSTDEEMDCEGCDHAQSFHRDELIGGTHEADVQSADVGPCDYDEQKPDTNERSNNETYKHCDCEGYLPPLCADCGRPIDPALRQWWASKNATVKA